MSEETQPDSAFHELSRIDVSSLTGKKGDFTYLPWTFAVEQLLNKYPESTWEAVKFPLPKQPELMVPYMETPMGYFVETWVKVGDVVRRHTHPVLNHYNKPIEKPTPFDINTSIMRCLAKTIAMHGLGLYIFAGEDLPTMTDPWSQEEYELFYFGLDGDRDNPDNKTELGFAAMAYSAADIFNAIWERHLVPHKRERTLTKEKERMNARIAAGHTVADEIATTLIEASQNDDDLAVQEISESLTPQEKTLIWARLDNGTKDTLQRMKKSQTTDKAA